MSRRSNGHLRCPRCKMHESLCICALIPSLVTRTRLVLVLHRLEARKTSNTGQLAALCLPNHQILLRGQENQQSSAFVAEEGTRPLLLFPHEDAVPLARFAAERVGDPGAHLPVTLIVPDGSWRQASKVRQRVPGLDKIPCVSLPPEADAPTIYRLRSEAHAHGMATMEAIARAYGILEGPEVRRALEDVFRTMVERTLWTRGQIDAEEVTGGLPVGTERHDPRRADARRSSV